MKGDVQVGAINLKNPTLQTSNLGCAIFKHKNHKWMLWNFWAHFFNSYTKVLQFSWPLLKDTSLNCFSDLTIEGVDRFIFVLESHSVILTYVCEFKDLFQINLDNSQKIITNKLVKQVPTFTRVGKFSVHLILSMNGQNKRWT